MDMGKVLAETSLYIIMFFVNEIQVMCVFLPNEIIEERHPVTSSTLPPLYH